MIDNNMFPALPGSQMSMDLATAQSSKLDAMTDFDTQLICDLIAGLRRPSEILAKYGLTQEDLVQRVNNPAWAEQYRETAKTWNADKNITQRIRLKASFLLEDSLVPLFNIIRDKAMPVAAKLEAIEKLTKISTVTNTADKGGGTGERHSITINIGPGVQPVRAEGRVVAHVPAVEVSQGEG